MQAVGFDGTPQALSVTKSVTMPIEVKTNECSTRAVVAQSKLGVVGIPLHTARNSARLSCLSGESPRLCCSSAGKSAGFIILRSGVRAPPPLQEALHQAGPFLCSELGFNGSLSRNALASETKNYPLKIAYRDIYCQTCCQRIIRFVSALACPF